MANDPYANIASPANSGYDAISAVETPGGDAYETVASIAAPERRTELRAYQEPSLPRRAITALRESFSPLVGNTPNQQLVNQQQNEAFTRQFPQISQQATDNASTAETEGIIPALFTPSPRLPQLPTIDSSGTTPAVANNLTPQISGAGNLSGVLAGIYNPVAGAVNSAIASPGGLLTLPLSGPLEAVPGLGKLVTGLFAGDMARQTVENAPRTLATITDPNATVQQKVEAVAGEALSAGLSGLAARHAIAEARALPQSQATIRLREEAAVTANKETATALENLAADIESQAAAQQKAAESAAKTQQEQAQAVAEQQQAQAQAAQAALAPPEVPKSTQIIEEANAPKSLANAAAIGAKQAEGNLTQLQAQINQTAVALPKIAEQAAPVEATATALQVPVEVDSKPAQIKQAVDAKETEYVYTVQRPFTPGGKGFIQVDAINPLAEGMERNVVSSNPADLRKAGADIPDVPDWVPQGQYALEQIKQFIKTGEPKNAIPIKKTASEVLRPQGEGASGVVELSRVEQGNGPAENPRETGNPPPQAEPVNLSNISESRLVTLAEQLGIDTKQMSGDRLRARIESNAYPDEINQVLARQSEAQQLIADSPVSVTPPDNRSARQKAAALRAQRAGLISGTAAEKWADQTISKIRKQGRNYSGFDVEYGAAATVKLLAELERGTVDFAKWSADQLREFGETVRPQLQKIWDTAQTKFRTPPDVPIYERENMGPNSARGYDRDIPTITNERQKQYATDLANFAERTGNWTGAYEKLRAIPPEYAPVAAAELAVRAQNIADPVVREAAIRNFATAALDATSQAGQTLQSASVANKTLEPLTGYMAWLGLVRKRLSDVVEPRVGENSGGKVRKGIGDAGKEAGEILSDAAAGEKLDKHDALVAPLRKIAKQTGLVWKDIFTDLPENQAARKAELFRRLAEDPRLASISDATKQKLADASERAWESIRNDVFRSEFSRLVDLPNITKDTELRIQETIPELIKQANLGLLDNEAFLSALGKQYGIEGLDSSTAVKLRALGEEAMRTPRGSERNRVFQKIQDTIFQTRGIDWPALVRDVWYRNVMSAPRTAVEIGMGGIVQGVHRTFETALDTAFGQGRPDLAFKMLGMFFKDAATGARLGGDLIATGDRTSLPRYEKQFLDSMDRLSKGQSMGGEIESLYRRGGTAQKIAVGPFEMVGRTLTALDYIGGQGVRQQQMLYAALVRGDKASLEAAMQRFNKDQTAAAAKQARTELPNGRPAEIIARQREILNDGISEDVKEFGNLMTEVTALNAAPVGIAGQVYKGLNSIPFFNVAKFPAGAAFLKAGLNLFQRYTDFLPGTGQLNFARTKLDPNTRFGKIFSLADLPVERQRQQIVAQYMGLAALGATAAYFLNNDDKDVQISGSWFGLSPEQQRQLRTAGEAPLSFKAPWTGGRWVSYKLTPLLPVFATVGHWRDQQRFNGKNFDDKTLSSKVVNSWLAGAVAIKDLSIASQASELVSGLLGKDNGAPDADKGLKAIANSVGSTAAGLIPLSSLLRELDQYEDQQRYVPGKDNPGVDLWLRQVPFVRRIANINERGDARPALDFFGHPVQVVVTPFNRHLAPLPPEGSAYKAVSDKISQGMTVPVPAPLEHVINAKAELVPPTADQQYFYQLNVRQAYERQIQADLAAFTAATPEQAADYSQKVMTRAAQYVRDRINAGVKFDEVPSDAKLSPALSPEYRKVTEANAAERGPTEQAAARVRINYEDISAMAPEQRGPALAGVLRDNLGEGRKVLSKLMSKTETRDALQKAESQLQPTSRAAYFRGEMNKLPADQRGAYLQREYSAGNLTLPVLRELSKAP